ncbi:hypothetical protein AB0B94_01140 [Micromonospora sp. NPDC048986]
MITRPRRRDDGDGHFGTFGVRYADVPVETADIVLPGGRYELVYRVPVD